MPPSLEGSLSLYSVQSLSRVRLFATPWTAAHQASLFITNFQSFLKLMSIESVMPYNHLILCPSVFPSIRVFSNESVLRIRWPQYWSFSFTISPSNEYSGLISLMINCFDLLWCCFKSFVGIVLTRNKLMLMNCGVGEDS